MPDFTIHVDRDDLARQDLAVAVPQLNAGTPDQPTDTVTTATHHGAGDARLAARQRSERDRAGRAPGGSGRSYAFRRS
ncbi:hypothetical protein [Actinoplanes friuliensis]|jgi:hypothetical protein|uniref:Uncharacterized protein n=1 Tax=Actinoplanes friuliensis DSM 7358 TaxID=1246995 RepID=U5W3G3_9ACTN|nr:hypothetical protein [Actinoplanes friuliensis]AGZ43659.1 hypothetical protein AFR_26990 [Actinoplanes friuliensis DSM 7358]